MRRREAKVFRFIKVSWMSLKKGPGIGLFARNRGIFDELVVMILILILNIIILVNRKYGVVMNLRELPLKIPE
ncbi:hypothetical protein CH367_02015 [Leptospira barantonii]|uniref:Uncharacterized protein n=1 Tax=Leptospira barantonii TaxID=2023184 RepID=A0ABX4NTA2_9LEPT|nr:hypothetical protein CH367_02015 [Leptospira barantonii]